MTAVMASLESVYVEDAPNVDWEDLQRAAAGDSAAFTGIVERHQNRLLRLCERYLADREEAQDAVQEVFLKAYRKASSYQPRGELYTWLYRIAVNDCLNRLRRRKIIRFLRLSADPSLAAFDPADDAPAPDRRLEARGRWRQTRNWLDELPLSQRSVLLLARFEGLSYKQISERLGITVSAVESRLFRAMRTLEEKRDRQADVTDRENVREDGDRQ